MASHTPINVFMDMTILLFYDFTHAIKSVLESKNKKT